VTPVGSDQQLRDLFERARAGERHAQDDLVRRLLPGLRARVRSMVGARLRGREEWSDIVQGACFELVRHLPAFEYRGDRALRAWLLHAARRKVLERVRYWSRTKRGGERGGDAELDAVAQLHESCVTAITPARSAIAREEVRRVQRAFAKLTDDQRRAIVYHRVMGMAHAEIAQRMGRREGAVRQLLFRAVAQLGRALAELQPPPKPRSRQS